MGSRLDNQVAKTQFYRLQGLRVLIGIVLVLFLDYLSQIGIHQFGLIAAVVFGTLIPGVFLTRGISSLIALLLHLAICVVIFFCLWFWEVVQLSHISGASEQIFRVYLIADFLDVFAIIYFVCFIATWIFWTSKHSLTLEAVAVSLLVIWSLSGHRNYQLDAPKKLSEIMWDDTFLLNRLLRLFHVSFESQHLLLLLAVVFTFALGIYLGLAGVRPLFVKNAFVEHKGKRSKILTFFVPAVMLVFLSLYAYQVNKRYSVEASRATSGVGQQDGEGKSPLGFHDAIGKTKQPAALVRLEGDYRKNPWSPMLYLREGALSKFNGKELVLASRKYDADVPRLKPGISFLRPEVKPSNWRTEVKHSVFLLSNHATVFAVDYPKVIRLIKNPDPQRFEVAYQAHSFAPLARPEELIGEEVGDANWDEDTWKHYLRAPASSSVADIKDTPREELKTPLFDGGDEDLRYKVLAKKFASTDQSPVQRAAAISEYLSEESIYTRKPGHQVTDKGDPVAPYLFAEKMRGYCVHFAHAAVYLMRLSGIPARIATGYLTDLTYAKDGHILLHLGDRHAWPEIYVRGQGWTVLDVTPAQAENEQVIIPDEKLLDELMSKIDPAEDLVAPLPSEEESQSKRDLLEEFIGNFAGKKTLGVILLSTFLLFVVLKLWLRLGFLITPPGKGQVLRAYGSLASLLTDIGISRYPGETRREFSSRIENVFAIDTAEISFLTEQACYAGRKDFTPSKPLRVLVFIHALSKSKIAPIWKRVISFFNPVSLFRVGGF